MINCWTNTEIPVYQLLFINYCQFTKVDENSKAGYWLIWKFKNEKNFFVTYLLKSSSPTKLTGHRRSKWGRRDRIFSFLTKTSNSATGKVYVYGFLRQFYALNEIRSVKINRVRLDLSSERTVILFNTNKNRLESSHRIEKQNQSRIFTFLSTNQWVTRSRFLLNKVRFVYLRWTGRLLSSPNWKGYYYLLLNNNKLCGINYEFVITVTLCLFLLLFSYFV